MEENTTLELGKGLVERLFSLAEREGMSVEDILSRALELYTRKPSSAAEVLEFVKLQTVRKPKLLKSPLEVFRAGYKEEGLI
ncbi:MAG: hypothetical protein GQ523_07745 [Methanophagales archaeon]|jgi:hypothetical protein|nr:hypothetical protein [Methanophagales archaeon]